MTKKASHHPLTYFVSCLPLFLRTYHHIIYHSDSLFVQANNITGEWPRLFCPFSSSQPAAISNFGIDCDEIECVQVGCCTEYNCYYDD